MDAKELMAQIEKILQNEGVDGVFGKALQAMTYSWVNSNELIATSVMERELKETLHYMDEAEADYAVLFYRCFTEGLQERALTLLVILGDTALEHVKRCTQLAAFSPIPGREGRLILSRVPQQETPQ